MHDDGQLSGDFVIWCMKSVQHCPGSSGGMPSQTFNIWWPESDAHQVTVSLQNYHTSPLNLKAAKIEIYVFLCPFFETHSRFFFCPSFPSGPPVIVGMSINIASIDSISEVNMVCFYCLISLLAPTEVGPVYPHTAVLGVHATPTPTPVPKHLGGKHSPMHLWLHDPLLASHPQTRPVIITGLNDRARQGIPLQSVLVFTLPPANQNLVVAFFFHKKYKNWLVVCFCHEQLIISSQFVHTFSCACTNRKACWGAKKSIWPTS